MIKAIPDIDSLEPLTAEDEACLRDVRQVLERHGRLHRFGVNLLHTHFSIAEDETLIEECDPDNRVLVIKPVKRLDLAGTQVIETNWTLTDYTPVLKCTQVCARSDTSSQHSKVHVNTPNPSD